MRRESNKHEKTECSDGHSCHWNRSMRNGTKSTKRCQLMVDAIFDTLHGGRKENDELTLYADDEVVFRKQDARSKISQVLCRKAADKSTLTLV